MGTNHHVVGFSLEKWWVIKETACLSRPSAWNLVVAAASFFLLMASGCTKQDPYVPPDLFYYFASYKVGKNPTTVTPTDVNQDGYTDLVTTNMGSNTLSILLGNGDGTFGDQVELNVCKEPRSLALGMFNSDPFPDVVLACSGADEVAILFGRADGKFQEGTRYPVHRTPIAIAIDDQQIPIKRRRAAIAVLGTVGEPHGPEKLPVRRKRGGAIRAEVNKHTIALDDGCRRSTAVLGILQCGIATRESLDVDDFVAGRGVETQQPQRHPGRLLDRSRQPDPAPDDDGRRPAAALDRCPPDHVLAFAPFQRKILLRRMSLAARASKLRPVFRFHGGSRQSQKQYGKKDG